MQETQHFSIRALALSVAAAELGRAILSTGQGSALRTKILFDVLTAVALVLLAALAGANTSRLQQKNFLSRCIRCVFLLWYLAESFHTAGMIQQVCWEEFLSMSFIGLLPLFLWAGWSLRCELFDRSAVVLWWLMAAGSVFCVLGLTGQFHWRNLISGQTDSVLVLPETVLYPEYFSFTILCSERKASVHTLESFWVLPIISVMISSGYALGQTLLFGQPSGTVQNGYPGRELLRAWSFGGISRFDSAFVLIWLAAALFRLCFLLRAARFLAETIISNPGYHGRSDPEAAR